MKIKHQTAKTTGAMAQLLAAHKSSFVSLHKGVSVKGKIIKLTPSEILVDVGAKTSAIVLEKDRNILHTILASFKVGDSVDVNVLSPESDTGQPVVSLRRYLGNIAWNELEKLAASHAKIDVKVSETAKAGYVVTTSFGVSGFLPQSHIAFTGNQAVAYGDTLLCEISTKD